MGDALMGGSNRSRRPGEWLFISASVQGLEPEDIRQPFNNDLVYADNETFDVEHGFIVNGEEVKHHQNVLEGELVEMYIKLRTPCSTQTPGL